MNCRQVTKLISDSRERTLNLQEKIGMKAHLLFCPHCRNFQQHCKQINKLMKQFADK
ncbi:zf-HC2 domain-containing protein [Necropsobacter rosorum]|uniref:zf-HC2 domain-containing protein n=1 Tax=Necropsobacter rosorum TaxID=908285 RepID=UPI0005096C9E